MKQPILAWMRRLHYTWRNVKNGVLIYSLGDTIATLITGEFSITRILGMAFLGATVYALEIPNWFLNIDRWTEKTKAGLKRNILRVGYSLLYFNPLWIARHMFFIALFSGEWEKISWGLLTAGGLSFLMNVPLSIVGNYVIQNKISFQWRYVASSIFSSFMAISYAMGAVWFR